ncbi:MAG: hypothetical protein HUJ26_20815 [Planctomycetaceae bacterium]|nr:hypothetical protein [Planctomycetaceae bacterium]
MVKSFQNIFALVFLLTVMSGCASLSNIVGEQVKFANPKKPAVEVICLWEPSEGKTPDGKPARGFEGTLLFFDADRTSPVGVHGEVTVSVFDDYGPRDSWNRPISEFRFTPEEWNHFISRGTFGTSYRIFIPYERKHPYQVKTSLSVKFVPASGGAEFQSRMSHVVLPGPLREGINTTLTTNAELRDRSPENLQKYVSATLTPPTRKPRIDTIHTWNPAQSSSGDIQLTRYQTTHGTSTGAISRLSESVSGADAESWGSTPPALSFQPETDGTEPVERVRRRFKLTP